MPQLLLLLVADRLFRQHPKPLPRKFWAVVVMAVEVLLAVVLLAVVVLAAVLLAFVVLAVVVLAVVPLAVVVLAVVVLAAEVLNLARTCKASYPSVPGQPNIVSIRDIFPFYSLQTIENTE